MDIETIPLATGILLTLAGFAGGLIDSIAGGGGLITVPALLAAGLPPSVALGTNKLQSVFGTSIAVSRYAKAGLMGTPGILTACLTAASAGAAGAWAVTKIAPDLLRHLIPWLLAIVAIYTAMNRHFGKTAGPARMEPVTFALTGGLLLGFYDGFFGPGAGSFWTVALVGLLGLDLRQATGYTKAANLASNLGALAFFLVHGSVHLTAAACMIAGQLLGARLGSGLVLGHGISIIRPVFLTVVFALTLKLMHQAWTTP